MSSWIKQRGGPPRWRWLLGVCLLLLAIAGAGTLALHTGDNSAGDVIGSSPATASTPPATLPATTLAALPGHTIRDGTAPLKVTLGAPVASNSPPPTLTPAVAGSWSVVGDSEVFTPVSTLNPCSSYALTVWSRTSSSEHAPLGRRRTVGLNVACPPLVAAQQALARLGYLAARLHPFYIVHIAADAETRREAAVHAFHPPRGALVADPADAPRVDSGHLDETTKGALTVYQGEHGLEETGEPNRATWESLLSAETANRHNRIPYTWLAVSEGSPETLAVHRGHRVIFTTAVNTGVPGAETAQGIFPIYSRFTSTTMSGTDVDGTKYVVPDVPWVNYFNGGDAVHGYPRASYGFPQSNGCVELPIEAAHTVFGMVRLGDVVVVS